jgi:hypothetical protein
MDARGLSLAILPAPAFNLFPEKIDRIVRATKSISRTRCCDSPSLIGSVLAHLEKPFL